MTAPEDIIKRLRTAAARAAMMLPVDSEVGRALLEAANDLGAPRERQPAIGDVRVYVNDEHGWRPFPVTQAGVAQLAQAVLDAQKAIRERDHALRRISELALAATCDHVWREDLGVCRRCGVER